MNMQELFKSGAPAKDAGPYKSFLDMIDGGGAGMSGDTFKGGGLISVLGNALGIAPRGAARERDLELAANAAAGAALNPKVVEPVIRAEEMTYSGRGSAGMPQDPRAIAADAMSALQPGMGAIRTTVLPPANQPSYDPRGPMYGDRNSVTDQELMTFAQSMHPDNRYFFLNSDRNTQVQSYLRAMGY
jgi:hypothetical protein